VFFLQIRLALCFKMLQRLCLYPVQVQRYPTLTYCIFYQFLIKVIHFYHFLNNYVHHTLMWWTYWFHRNSIFLRISTKISIGRRFWSNGPMDWLQICWLCWSYSNLGLKEANFPDFDDFEVVFHQILTGSRYLGFTKSGARTVIFAHALNALKRLDSRFLLASSSV
jgi:hypothetical protein